MSAFGWFIALYTGSALVLLAALWFLREWRERRRFEEQRRRKVFHCVRCGAVYSVRKADTKEGEPCPECGYRNYELSY